MAKMNIVTKGITDMMEQIDRMGLDLRMAANEALQETQQLVQEKVATAAGAYAGRGRKGYATGDMYSSIGAVDPLQWEGDVATIGVGFKLPAGGGWHSIFIMYGTPRISKDAAVYNAIRGSATRSQIEQKQEEVLRRYMSIGD